MSIGISQDHRELAQAFSSWASSRKPLEAIRAAELDETADFSEFCTGLTDMGLGSIAVPDDHGGAAGSIMDLAVTVEALASELVPGPILGTAIWSVVGSGREQVAAGEQLIALCVGSSVSVDGGRASGTLEVVYDAFGATSVLVPGEGTWWLVSLAGAELSALTSPDLSRRAASVVLTSADATEAAMPGHVLDVLLAFAAAEASGIAHWCVRTAVDYAKVREQFGAPIGSFQSIKHLCSTMLEQAETATAAAWDAARALDEVIGGAPTDQSHYAASVAGVLAIPSALDVAHNCIQILGGIGFTFEHDAHFYLRRVLALRALVGSAHAHERNLAALAQHVQRSAQIEYDGADASIRDEVRALLAGVDPEDPRAGLVETGLLVPHWPRPYGRGAGPVEQLVIDEELQRASIIRPDIKIAGWAVPTIVFNGTDEQREQFVMPSLRGEITWCQLFSEPGAGSDLASLRTKAVRVAGGWELTGQKVWTSLAHQAQWGITLARTDADVPQHKGISYFLVDMTSPGITIAPLREMTGEAMFNEVFLDSVFVPDELMVGVPGDGWSLARSTLANERVAMASHNLGLGIDMALEIAREGLDPVDEARVGHAVAVAQVAGLLGDRATLRSISGAGPGAESSVAKLLGVKSRQDAATLVMELLGERALSNDAFSQRAVQQQLLTRCLSIAGGTTQVLRNIVAERILGLPR